MKDIFPSELQPGDRICIHRAVPLMPVPKAPGSKTAIWEALRVAKTVRGIVDIVAVDKHSPSTVWIRVVGVIAGTRETFEGWINTNALLGPNKYNLCEKGVVQ